MHAGLRGKDSNSAAYTGNAPWGVTDLKAAIRYVRHNTSSIPGSKDRMVVFGMSGGGAQSAIAGASGDSALYTPHLRSLGAAMDTSDAVAGAMCWCPITNLDRANAACEWNKSATGVYLSGTYYDHLVKVVDESLNNFLKDTKLPYTPSSSVMAGMGAAPGGAGMHGGGVPGGASQSATTYKTVKAYFAHLNSAGTWAIYDAATNTAKVTSLEGFVKSQKTATKGVGAFDGPDRSVGENVVMGSGTSGLHFAAVSEQVIEANETAYAKLSGWKSTYAASQYTSDFAETDTVGQDVTHRVDMYNPMYYFATVWGLAHTVAERTGDATANFIGWVKDTVAK